MARESLSIEQVMAIVDRVKGTSTQTAVPTVQVPKDSFTSTVDGITKGWPFLLAMASIAFWLMQSIYGINATLQQHDTRITTNADAVKSIETKLDSASVANSDIIRRLDSLQTAVDNLKANSSNK